MTSALHQVATGVWTPGVRVDRISASPDGARWAWWRTRASNPDLVARERVYCADLRDGREVFAVDGPEIVRAIGWTARDHLAVLRELPRKTAALRVHEAPDGGVLRETPLAYTGYTEARITTSLDQTVCLVSPVWRTGLSEQPHAWVLRAQSGEVLRGVDPNRWRTLGPPSRASLDPEGQRVAVTFASPAIVRGRGCVLFLSTDGGATDERIVTLARQSSPGAPRWIGRAACLVFASWDLRGGELVRVPDETTLGAARPVLGPRDTLSMLDLHPEHPFGVALDATPGRATARWVDLGAGAPTPWPLPPLRHSVSALAITHDGMGLVLVARGGERALVEHVDARTGVTRACVEFAMPTAPIEAGVTLRRVPGGYALSQCMRDGGATVFRLDAEALGI